MKLDGFASAFNSCSFNNVLHIGGLRVKQIIITPTRKSSKFCKVSKTEISSRESWVSPQLQTIEKNCGLADFDSLNCGLAVADYF